MIGFEHRFRAWVSAGSFTLVGLAEFFGVSQGDILAWLKGSRVPNDMADVEEKMAELEWAIGWD